MTTTTIVKRAVLHTVEQEWDALAARTAASPFLRPGWVKAWWDAFGVGDLEVLTVRRAGRLAGVLPVARRSGLVRSPTNGHTPEFGAVAEDDTAAAALLGQLLSDAPRRAVLDYIDAESLSAGAWPVVAKRYGYRDLVTGLLRSPYIDVTGSWEVYCQRFSRGRRKDLGRRRRRLEERGEVTLDIARSNRGLPERLDEAFAIEEASWKGKEGTAVNCQPAVRRFYHDIAAWAAAYGWLRLAFLRLDGKAVAFDLGLEDGRSLYSLKIGYDPAYAKYGPGMLLALDLVEYAFARPLTSYEWLGEDDVWKREWTDGHRTRQRIALFRGSALGGLERHAAATAASCIVRGKAWARERLPAWATSPTRKVARRMRLID